eukprot:gene7374-8775_t
MGYVGGAVYRVGYLVGRLVGYDVGYDVGYLVGRFVGYALLLLPRLVVERLPLLLPLRWADPRTGAVLLSALVDPPSPTATASRRALRAPALRMTFVVPAAPSRGMRR